MANFNTIAYNGSIYVAGATKTTDSQSLLYSSIFYSTDGISWTASGGLTDVTCYSITWTGSYFLAAGPNFFTFSENGLTWTYSRMTWYVLPYLSTFARLNSYYVLPRIADSLASLFQNNVSSIWSESNYCLV